MCRSHHRMDFTIVALNVKWNVILEEGSAGRDDEVFRRFFLLENTHSITHRFHSI